MMDDKVVIDTFGGSCPFQAEGTVDGQEFYFRSRGSSWTFAVGGDVVMAPAWLYEEDYGSEPYEAGWITDDEARAFITKAVSLYREHAASSDQAPASPVA